MFDQLAARRKRKAEAKYQAKHGAGVETQREMEEAAAKQRHPSGYKPKHHKHELVIYGADKGVLMSRCSTCGYVQVGE